MFYLFLILIIAAGFLMAEIFMGKVNFWEKLSIGYGLGLGSFYLILFVLEINRYPFTSVSLFFLCFLFFIIVAFIYRILPKGSTLVQPKVKFNKAGWIMLTILLLIIGWIFVVSMYWPVHEWDALTLYDYRAKVIVNQMSLSNAIPFFVSGNDLYYLVYSYILSFFHGFSYAFNGPNPQIFYFLYFVFFLLSFFIFSNHKAGSNWSVLGVLVLATSSLLFSRSVSVFPNIVYLYYFISACFLAERFFKKQKKGDFILMSVFLGFATLVRDQEPFYLILFGLLFFVCVYRKKFKLFITGPLIFLLMAGSWFVYRSSLFPTGGKLTLYRPLEFSITRIVEVINYLYQTLLPDYGLFFLLAFISILFNLKKVKGQAFFLLTWSGALVLFIAGTYLLSSWYKFWNDIGDSVRRTALFIIPMSIYIAISMLSKKETLE